MDKFLKNRIVAIIVFLALVGITVYITNFYHSQLTSSPIAENLTNINYEQQIYAGTNSMVEFNNYTFPSKHRRSFATKRYAASSE